MVLLELVTIHSCTNLTTINLSNTKIIGLSSFNNCSSLTTIDLPQLITIGNNGFNSCISLSIMDLPNVITIGQSAFYDCDALTTIDLPSVVTIGDYSAFGFCNNLTIVNLPSVVTIGAEAFLNSPSLISVIIPKCLILGTSSGDNSVFSGCSAGLEVTTNIFLRTCDSGSPDGDLVYVTGTLTGTVNYVEDYNYVAYTGNDIGTVSYLTDNVYLNEVTISDSGIISKSDDKVTTTTTQTLDSSSGFPYFLLSTNGSTSTMSYYHNIGIGRHILTSDFDDGAGTVVYNNFSIGGGVISSYSEDLVTSDVSSLDVYPTSIDIAATGNLNISSGNTIAVTSTTFSMNGSDGVSGTFSNPTSITVVNGIITAIS